MSKRLAWWLGVAVPLGFLLVVGGTGAHAHEERTAAGVELVVGWGEEPAYTGFMNSVEVTVSEAGGDPVTDLGNALEVEVTKGSEKITLPVVAVAGSPGVYHAPLTPTRPGAYSIRLTGNVRGQAVDETFTSSPTTFDEVQEASSIQFPAKDPSPGQLATRLDREVPRLSARADAMDAALAEAEDRADAARTLAMAGLGAGVLGLAAGAAGLLAARRRRSSRAGVNGAEGSREPEHVRSLSG